MHLLLYSGDDGLTAFRLSTFLTVVFFIGAGYGFLRLIADIARELFPSLRHRE